MTGEKGTNKAITVERVLAWRPCHHDEARLLEISGGRREMTVLEISDLENVSALDRIWLLARPEIVGKLELAEWGCDCAERALPVWESWAKQHSPDLLDAPRNAIETKRRHLRGEATDEELTAARAAIDAARDAAWTAWGAARAAIAAARAAIAAARDAAWDAAEVAWDDEEAWQLDRLKKYLQEKGE